MVNYGETFYRRHTALIQLQCSKINVKKIAFGNKEHTIDKKMGSHLDTSYQGSSQLAFPFRRRLSKQIFNMAAVVSDRTFNGFNFF